MNLSALRDWGDRNAPEARLVLRITVAGIVAFALARALDLAQPYWAVITAVIVMQASVGGSLKAVLDRFVGTLSGAAFGAVVAVAIPHESDLMLAVALVVALVPLAWVAAVYPSFRLAPVTAVIVLLPVVGAEGGALGMALERVIEIGLGNTVGLAVALTILPARAHGLLTATAARVAALEARLVDALLGPLTGDGGTADSTRLDTQLQASLKALESAADEARRERRSRLTDQPDPEPLVRTLTRVRNDLATVARAAAGDSAAAPANAAIDAHLRPAIAGLRRQLTAFLAGLETALKDRCPPPPIQPVDDALAAYFTEVAAVRAEGLTRDLPVEPVARLFMLRLAMEQLCQDLRDLRDRVDELALKPKPATAE